MRSIGIAGGLGALIASLQDIRPLVMPLSQGPGVRDWRKGGSFDPRINRHTSKPHEHKREIARRLRQQAVVSDADRIRSGGADQIRAGEAA